MSQQHKHRWLVDRLEYMTGDVVQVYYVCNCGGSAQKHEFIGMVPDEANSE